MSKQITTAQTLYVAAVEAQRKWKQANEQIVFNTILQRCEFAARNQHLFHCTFSFKELLERRFITTKGELSLLGTSVTLKLQDAGFVVDFDKVGKDKVDLVVSFGSAH